MGTRAGGRKGDGITYGGDAGRPLSALLSQVLVAYTVEFDNEFERKMSESGYVGARLSLVVWCNLMRFVAVDGISVRDLAGQACATEQGLKFVLGCLERWRFLVLEPASGDDRSVPLAVHRRAGRELRAGWGSARGIRAEWIVRPTRRGLKAIEIWPPLFGVIESRWKARFGEEMIGRLRKSLVAVAGRLEVELPQALPGEWLGPEVYPPKVTPGPGGLTLPTLLSQLLLEYGLEFKRESHLSIELCANALRVLGEKPVRVAEIAALTGSSPERTGVGWMLKPYVAVGADPTARRGKVAWLTPLGLAAQQTYRKLSEEIEKRWEERFGNKEIHELRECLLGLFTKRGADGLALSAGMVPPERVVRGGKQAPALGRRDVGAAARKRMHDLVEQTQAFVKDPANALPHYPLWDMNRGFGP